MGSHHLNASSSFSSHSSPTFHHTPGEHPPIRSTAQSDTARDMRDVRCNPTYTDLFVGDTFCGCKIFETVLNGSKQPVDRRPTDTERGDIIRSGNVFVYQGKDNGIKRWTDGHHWSPSRISGNFLVYRELTGPFPPGHKKKALKRKSVDEDERPGLRQGSPSSFEDASQLDGDRSPSGQDIPSMMRRQSRQETPSSDKRQAERSLYGSLTKSYDFKFGGLMKKTMSVLVDGRAYHLVAYYDPREVHAGIIKDSRSHPELMNVLPRANLLYKQSWRAPIELANHQLHGFAHSPHSYQPPATLGLPPPLGFSTYAAGPYSSQSQSPYQSPHYGAPSSHGSQPHTQPQYDQPHYAQQAPAYPQQAPTPHPQQLLHYGYSAFAPQHSVKSQPYLVPTSLSHDPDDPNNPWMCPGTDGYPLFRHPHWTGPPDQQTHPNSTY